mgnify:CR=1 FL=1
MVKGGIVSGSMQAWFGVEMGSILYSFAATLFGEGQARFEGELMPAAEALQKAGLTPVELGPKEGLGLINGTQFSTAQALAALFDAWRLSEGAIVASALSTDAIMGSTAPLRAGIHALRGHRGQIDVATAMRFLDESAAAGEAARARRREEMRQEQELEKERAVGIGQRARIEAQERAAKVQRRVTRVVVTALVVSTPLLFGLIGSWMAKHSREQVFNEREEVFRTREDSFESSRHPSEEAPGT